MLSNSRQSSTDQNRNEILPHPVTIIILKSRLVWWRSEVEALLHINSAMGSAAAFVKSSLEPSQKTVSEAIAHYQARTQSKGTREMSLLKSFL